jgi:hypothetical protein
MMTFGIGAMRTIYTAGGADAAQLSVSGVPQSVRTTVRCGAGRRCQGTVRPPLIPLQLLRR